MKQIVQLVCVLLLFQGATAAQISITQQYALGGSGNENISYSPMSKTSDGYYLLCINSDSPVSGTKTSPRFGTSNDGWIMKVDAGGNPLWQKSYGGTEDEEGGGNLELGGAYYWGFTSNSDVSGVKTWPLYGTSPGRSDYWLVKTDLLGNEIWQKVYGTESKDHLSSMVALPDGNILLAGITMSDVSIDKTEPSRGGNDFWMLAVDTAGNKLWDKTLGGNWFESLVMVHVLNDGILLLGETSSTISGDKQTPLYGVTNVWIVKTDFSGNIIWEQTLGSTGIDYIDGIHITDDRLICVGTSDSDGNGGNLSVNNKGITNGWIAELDIADGTVLRSRGIGGNDRDWMSYVEKLENGSYLLVGSATSGINGDKTLPSLGDTDIWIVLLDSAWNITDQYVLGGYGMDGSFSAYKNTDGSLTVLCFTNSVAGADKQMPFFGGTSDAWVINLKHSLSSPKSMGLAKLQVYPNPATDICTLVLPENVQYERLRIVNSAGQTVYETNLNIAEGNTYMLNTASWAPGAYFIDLQNKQGLSLRSTLLKK